MRLNITELSGNITLGFGKMSLCTNFSFLFSFRLVLFFNLFSRLVLKNTFF